MKQLNHSKKSKWIAILLAVFLGTAAVGGLFASLYTNEMGLYKKPLKNVIEHHQKDLQYYYSIKIIDSRENNTDFPSIPNMEYGILKSYDGLLQSANISDTNNYIYTNFHETKPLDTSYIIQYISGTSETYRLERPTLISSLSGNSMGFIPEFNLTKQNRNWINRIVYYKQNGIFYFESAGHSFPIYHISVSNTYVEAATKFSQKQVEDHEKFTFNRESRTYESDSGNCKPLNTANFKKWDHLHCEGSQFSPTDIDTVSTQDMLPQMEHAENVKLITKPSEDPEEEQDISCPYLYYETQNNSAENTYWVVSNVKKKIDTSSSDLFAKQATFLTNLYKYRYLFIGSVIFFGTAFILALGYLCYLAKIAKAEGTLSAKKWHKVPLLIYLSIMAILILVCIWIIQYNILWPVILGTMNTHTAFPIALIIMLLCMIFTISIWVNLTERYYGKMLWKYSVTGILTTYLKKLFHLFRQNTGLIVKGGAAFAAICLIELFCMFLSLWASDRDATILFLDWIAFKIIAFPIFCLILLQLKRLQAGSKRLAEGNLRSKLDTEKMLWEFKKHGEYLNQISDGMAIALEERLRSERFKTELITNVSHDIKTPLTSIINYVDLLQKNNISPEEKQEYLNVLDRQSARLKKLIEDLLEASKASAGTLPVNLDDCDIDILLTQTAGEYEEKLSNSQLELIIQKKDMPSHIQADNRHLWRVFDNLMNNICKYSQPGTRVYINQKTEPGRICISFLNTSKYALNISGDELMERFVRGDSSRNTEGNGLGLSIARSLTELMNGTLHISIEGDLFKVIIAFPVDAKQYSLESLRF